MDYGKFKFDQEKKERENKKKQKQTQLKEIRMQPKIEPHDMQFKAKHIRDFLEQGNKVKVTVRFRGREMAHTERGRVVLGKIMDLLEDSYTVDRNPTMEGRFMSMIVSPNSKKSRPESKQGSDQSSQESSTSGKERSGTQESGE